MALSAKIKKQFEERMGMSINELSEATDNTRYDMLMKSKPKKAKNEFGRGYVNFGLSVSSKQKDKENMEILRNW